MGAVLAMKTFLSVVSVIAMAALTGCQPVVQKLTGASQGQVTLPPEALAGPVMLVEIPSREASAVLVRVAVNKDVETWLATDNISLSFQRGVLVASRGLGFDLMAADAGNSLTAIAGEGPEVYRRHMRYLNGEHHSAYLMAGCGMTFVGSEAVEGQHLQRLEEHCQTRKNQFTNTFWLNEAGEIDRSRQWVSPQIGYLSTKLRSK